jgi:hypothetical protein
MAAENDIVFFGNATTAHNSVLLTLNRWLTYGPKKYYNALENFQGTEPEWETVPMVYAKEHPDPDLIDADLDSALAGVGGRLCGTLGNAAIETSGQPRMTGQVAFSDPEVEELYAAGKLSLSVAHRAVEDKANPGHLLGKVKPNHILIFPQDDLNQPRDLGAMLLNKDDLILENAGRIISGTNKQKFKEALSALWNLFTDMGGNDGGEEPRPPAEEEENGEEPMTEELTQKLKAAEEALANKTAEFEMLKASVDAQAEILKTFEQKQSNQEWETLKNKLPKGWVAGDKEAETRKEYEGDKTAFLNKLLDAPKGEPTKEEGEPFANKSSDDDHLATIRELRESTGRMR